MVPPAPSQKPLVRIVCAYLAHSCPGWPDARAVEKSHQRFLCKCSTHAMHILPNPMQILSKSVQSYTNPMKPIQMYVLQILRRSCGNLVQILCKSYGNPNNICCKSLQIPCQIHPNLSKSYKQAIPIRCKIVCKSLQIVPSRILWTS